MKVYLGIGLDHDAGVVLADKNGVVHLAASEERFTRVKNHAGFPTQALKWVLSEAKKLFGELEVTDVAFGTYAEITPGRLKNIIDMTVKQPFEYKPFGKNSDYFNAWLTPGDKFLSNLSKEKINATDLKEIAVQYLGSYLQSNFGIGATIYLSKHHDSHAASAFWPSGFNSALIVTMDGQGDGESITVQLGNRFEAGSRLESIYRAPYSSSLGHIYSAITNLFGLKTNRHEGKILGLVASGGPSEVYNKLKSIIRLEKGEITVNLPRVEYASKKQQDIYRELRHTDLLELFVENIKVNNFADLAYGAQELIEKITIEFIEYWLDKYPVDNIALAGGLFANVKLNQVIAENFFPRKVYIYPHMGDGGLAAGAMWNMLSELEIKIDSNPHESMLMGPIAQNITKDIQFLNEFNIDQIENFVNDDVGFIDLIIHLIIEGFYCGLVHGRMEFGPRALCSRTILADPRSKTVNADLNKKLNRSEYMPFAPVVQEEYMSILFDIERHSNLKPFQYMTMLCKVRSEWVNKIPAVVHTDNTARPQSVVKDKNIFVWNLIEKFRELTGIPCLINTSFNLHEEPIICTLEDAFRALHMNGVDFVANEGIIYYSNSNIRIKNSIELYTSKKV
jgi:carbamoyltransferase